MKRIALLCSLLVLTFGCRTAVEVPEGTEVQVWPLERFATLSADDAVANAYSRIVMDWIIVQKKQPPCITVRTQGKPEADPAWRLANRLADEKLVTTRLYGDDFFILQSEITYFHTPQDETIRRAMHFQLTHAENTRPGWKSPTYILKN